MNLIASGIFGLLCSVAASFVFWKLMMSIRPKIMISPKICKSTRNGSTRYGLKFVNHTNASITDVHLELRMLHARNHASGIVYDVIDLPLTKNSLFEIPKLDGNETEAFYAIRVGIDADLDKLWNEPDHQHLQFVIRATHSKSGFHASVRQEFRSKSDIVNGDHLTGTNLNVC